MVSVCFPRVKPQILNFSFNRSLKGIKWQTDTCVLNNSPLSQLLHSGLKRKFERGEMILPSDVLLTAFMQIK